MIRTYLVTIITMSPEVGSDPVLVQGVITTELNLDRDFLSLATDKEIYDFNSDFWERHREDFISPYIEKYSRCRILQWQELNYEKAREQITKAN